MMEISFSDGIYLPKPVPERLRSVLVKDLTISNPAYEEAIKFQRSVAKLSPEIKLFSETNNSLKIPRGFLFQLIHLLKQNEISYVFKDETVGIPCLIENVSCDLRAYQKEAIEKALKYRQGVIVSPCGSGKTVMGVVFIALAGQKTLWVTHTKELMYQTLERIRQFLGIQASEIGIIGDGVKKIGEKVTVGLVQSLVNFDQNALKNGFGTIIIDEAHRVPSKTFQMIVEISKAKYRLGLTATPKRKDGLEKILYNVVGQIVYQITEANLLVENQILLPKVEKMFTNFKSKEENYVKLIGQLVLDDMRNEFIVRTIEETLADSDVALLLTNRVEHCLVLENLIATSLPKLSVAVLNGKVKKCDREAIIKKAKINEIQLIIATQLADEGLDIPNLTKLYLATPSKSPSKLMQQIGRIMRNIEGKETPIVYDFVDFYVPILKHHATIRNSVYLELGCFD